MVSVFSRPQLRQLFFRLFDPVLLLSAMLIAGYLRWGHLPVGIDWVPLFFLASIGMVIFNINGSYEVLKTLNLSDWCRRPAIALLITITMFLALAYIFKISESFSRIVIIGWAVSTFVSLIISRVVTYRLVISLQRQGIGLDKTILVGNPDQCFAFLGHLESHPECGIQPVAIASNSLKPRQSSTITIGHISDLPNLIETLDVKRVIICGLIGSDGIVVDVLQRLYKHPVEIEYAPDQSLLPIFSFRVDDCGGRPLLNLSANPMTHEAQMLKIVEDKIISTILILVLFPLMIAVAIVIKLTSRGPILFIQERHGLHGKVIKVYKFRSMYCANTNGSKIDELNRASMSNSALMPKFQASSMATNANSIAALTANTAPIAIVDNSEIVVPIVSQSFEQARKDDPRITPIGRLIRKTSIDELPQLFNVLFGEMSLVGPRPHAIKHNKQYSESIDDLMRRHYVKPGITGLAQVSGARGETPNTEAMRRRIQYDLEYIRNWSPWLDIKILSLTLIRGIFTKQP